MCVEDGVARACNHATVALVVKATKLASRRFSQMHAVYAMTVQTFVRLHARARPHTTAQRAIACPSLCEQSFELVTSEAVQYRT